LKEVIGMLKNKGKIRNSLSVGKSGNSLLRLFRSDTDFQACPISLERTDQEEDYDACAQKRVGNAMLEAEYKKAKAIMTLQQNRNFY
jgi:hypothetical protein